VSESNSCRSESLQRLEELTPRLTSVPSLVLHPACNIAELKFEQGGGKLVGLFKSHDTAIAMSYVSAGSVMPLHNHNEIEVLGVSEGLVEVHFPDGSVKQLKQYEVMVLDVRQPHEVHYLTDTRMWAVTMPASPDFPEGIPNDRQATTP
jgi:quercetin dioxygenase-like cupin family protein